MLKNECFKTFVFVNMSDPFQTLMHVYCGGADSGKSDAFPAIAVAILIATLLDIMKRPIVPYINRVFPPTLRFHPDFIHNWSPEFTLPINLMINFSLKWIGTTSNESMQFGYHRVPGFKIRDDIHVFKFKMGVVLHIHLANNMILQISTITEPDRCIGFSCESEIYIPNISIVIRGCVDDLAKHVLDATGLTLPKTDAETGGIFAINGSGITYNSDQSQKTTATTATTAIAIGSSARTINKTFSYAAMYKGLILIQGTQYDGYNKKKPIFPSHCTI